MGDVVGIRWGAEFVGRVPELARLEALLETVPAGGGVGVLVGGDAGVGKTRLTAEFIARAASGGAAWAVGRCVDLGAGGLPYLPFAEALASLVALPESGEGAAAGAAVRSVARERPALLRLTGQVGNASGADDAVQRLALYEAVAVALRAAAAAAGSLVLVLEDLHWADASSRDLLRFLLSRLMDERVLVLGTYRSDDLHRRHPLRGLLAELVRLPRVERLDLGPFDDDELRNYLYTLHGGALDDRVVHDIRARSEGNAFYAGELLVSAGDDGTVPLPGGLADVLLARVERLPEQVQRVARVASVAGRRVADGLLRRAFTLAEAAASPGPAVSPSLPGGVAGPPAGAESAAAHDALRDAVAHQVLVPDGTDRFAFRHALLQEAVYTDLLPGERARLHGLYAELLASDPDAATAADLARHSFESHNLPGALSAWLRAAQEAERRLAPAEALSHYEHVLRLWPDVPADRRPPGTDTARLTLEAARAASASGEFRRAIALGRAAATAAADAGDVELEARARYCLAVFLSENDQDQLAMDEVQRVYALLDGLGPQPARVWAATVEARIVTGRGDLWDARREHLLRTRELVKKALVEARQLGMVSAEADLLITLAKSDALITGPEAAAQRLAEAGRRGIEAGDPEIALRVAFNLGYNALDAGDLDAARQHLEGGLDGAERAGLASSMFAIESRLMLTQVLVVTGAWDDALRAVAVEQPRLPAREALFLVVPALPVHAAREPARLPALVAELEACDDAYPIHWHLVYAPLAAAETWLGHHREAVDAVEKALESHRKAGSPLAMGGVQTAALGIAALADARQAGASRPGDGEQVQALLEHARQVAATGVTRLRTMGPEGRAWLLRAEADALRWAGSGDGDVEAWREVCAAFGYGHVHEAARSQWRLAEALLAAGGQGGRAEATQLLRQARVTAVRLRATPLRDAVDAAAARHRLDLGRGPAGQRVLTPREGEVIRLVAEGLTNREIGARLFISEKTASVHVSNLLAKLGASSRAEAVAVAHRRGLIGP